MEDGRPFRPNYLSELFGKFLASSNHQSGALGRGADGSDRYFPAQLVRAFACGGRVVNRLRKRGGRCGRQLVAFPHPAEELCLLSLQLSCAVFQTRGLALHAEDLLACVLCVPAHGSPPFLDLLTALSGLFQLLSQRVRQRLRPFMRRLLLCKLVLHAFALALSRNISH